MQKKQINNTIIPAIALAPHHFKHIQICIQNSRDIYTWLHVSCISCFKYCQTIYLRFATLIECHKKLSPVELSINGITTCQWTRLCRQMWNII